MGALFSRVKTWSATEDVTASDLNAEFDNILDNLTIANIDDYSATVGQMQTTVDPGEAGTESLATTGAGELARLRHMIKEISGEDQWYESPVSSILGLANAIGTGLTANRIVSGKVRSSGSNDQPLFLTAIGTAATVTLFGSTTNFIYYVDGVEYTISTDVTLTGLTAAPSSNNTCLINDAQAADDTYTKYAGEDGSSIPVDTMGTEISSLVGEFAAFKLDGVATEYFIAYVESSTALTKAHRGFFFDSSNAPVKRSAYTNNDTITLMKLAWIFAKSDGTLTATYNNPVWAKTQPSSPSQGDYWYDIANNTWKVYGVGSYSSASAHLVGIAIIDSSSNCLAARSFEFFKGYDSQNTCELFYKSATEVISREPGAVVNVWGTTVKSDRNIRTWDITTDLDDPDKITTEGASTKYFAYLSNYGDTILSDIKPLDRREDLGGLYHPFASWRCVGEFFNDGSSDIDANTVNSEFTRYETEPLREASAALHVEVRDKVIYLTGSSAAEYLPPAAKTKGQSFKIYHKGTSLSQVYTLTAFGSEVFSLNGSTTMGMYTNGEMFHLYSDGVGYQVENHFCATTWSAAGTLAIGAVTTPPTKGTMNSDSIIWRREGSEARFQVDFYQTVAGTAGSGDYLLTLNANMTIDTNVVEANTEASTVSIISQGVLPSNFGGNAGASLTSSNLTSGVAIVYDTTQVRLSSIIGAAALANWGSASFGLGNAVVRLSGWIKAPISGWLP